MRTSVGKLSKIATLLLGNNQMQISIYSLLLKYNFYSAGFENSLGASRVIFK